MLLQIQYAGQGSLRKKMDTQQHKGFLSQLMAKSPLYTLSRRQPARRSYRTIGLPEKDESEADSHHFSDTGLTTVKCC